MISNDAPGFPGAFSIKFNTAIKYGFQLNMIKGF
jgi:hypothetical protein